MPNCIFGLMLSFLLSFPAAASADWFLDVETGIAFPGYNDIQVPNDQTGSRFSLTDNLDVSNQFVYRLRAGYQTGRHCISVFAAPLRLEGSGILDSDIQFAEETFSQGEEVNGFYRFDSYRLTWRYLIVDSPVFSFAGGLTAKIRDAEIRLETARTSANTTNTGFVPLLSFKLVWKPGNRLGAVLEGDALAGPQGRAEDVFIGVLFCASERIDLRAGYRLIEGGADVESVYNFTLVNFLTAGATIRL